MFFVTSRVLFKFSAIRVFCVAFFLAASTVVVPANANPKYAALVVHSGSGDVLFSRYPDKKLYPASLTKMMTLYLLFDEIEAGRLSLNSKLKVSTRAAGQPPSKLGVRSRSTIDVETAIKALVVKSANDVAVVVAEAISGSEWKFSQKMTQKARQLGMRRTTFRNASGLPDRRQITTARDLATLSRRLIQDHEKYFHYFNEKSFVWKGKTYRTHNRLVRDYSGADGLKTGYTRRSGFNLATTANRNGHRLIGIVLGGRSSRTRDAHMRKILDQSFSRIKEQPTLIASLHRNVPKPRMKPTLVARLEKEFEIAKAPTLAANSVLQAEVQSAAQSFGTVSSLTTDRPMTSISANDVTGQKDVIGALIAATQTQENAEISPLAWQALGFNPKTQIGVTTSDIQIGQGDFEFSIPLDWHVQLGAFLSKRSAQKQLQKAIRLAKLTNVDSMVSPPKTTSSSSQGGKTKPLYRALFIDLTEAEALAVCNKIKKVRMDCVVRSKLQDQ